MERVEFMKKNTTDSVMAQEHHILNKDIDWHTGKLTDMVYKSFRAAATTTEAGGTSGGVMVAVKKWAPAWDDDTQRDFDKHPGRVVFCWTETARIKKVAKYSVYLHVEKDKEDENRAILITIGKHDGMRLPRYALDIQNDSNSVRRAAPVVTIQFHDQVSL